MALFASVENCCFLVRCVLLRAAVSSGRSSKQGIDDCCVKTKKYFTVPQISLACRGFDPIVPKPFQDSFWPDLTVLDRICINFRDQI